MTDETTNTDVVALKPAAAEPKAKRGRPAKRAGEPKAAKKAAKPVKKAKKLKAKKPVAKKAQGKSKAKVANSNARAWTGQGQAFSMQGLSQTQKATDKMMQMNADAVKEFWQTGAREWQETQEKLMAFAREGGKGLFVSSDSTNKTLGNALEYSRENTEALVETGNILSEATRKMAEELYNFANRTFAKNVEYSKEFLSCRTLNDLMDLQNKIFLANAEELFDESITLSDLTFQAAYEAAEPIQDRANEATDHLHKVMAA